MAGYSNPYLPGAPGSGPGGLDERKRALLAHITGHGAPSAANAGGRVMNPGSAFGSLPHFAPNINSVFGQNPGEQFSGVDPASIQQAIQSPLAGQSGGTNAPMGGPAPMGSSPSFGGVDTGGTQHVFPQASPSPFMPKPPNQFFGNGLNSGVQGLSALLSGYGGAGGGFWRGY